MFVLVQLELLRVPALELAQLAAVLDHVRILETAAFLRSTNNRKAASTTFFWEVLFIKESLCYGFQGRVNIKMVETPGHRAPPPPRWGPRTPSAGTRGAWCGGRGRARGWRWSRGCPSLACSHHHHHLLEMSTTFMKNLDNLITL